jgi:hypothetical protein
MNEAGQPFSKKEALTAFFKLMAAGFATGAKPELFPRFPGDESTQRHVWQDDSGWLGIDEWRTTPLGDGSNGTTSLYFAGTLVWEMQYGGYYPERAMPVLRQALALNYTNRRWFGGRGHGTLGVGNFIYHNLPVAGIDGEGWGNFSEFSGTEYIEEHAAGEWLTIGIHYYRGGFLIKPPT